MLTIFCSMATLFTIGGCVTNVMNKWYAFLLWEIANVIMIAYNVHNNDMNQAAYFMVLTVISGWGLYDRLSKKEKNNI